MTEDATPMRADARRNREQLIAAARDVFIEQGFDAPLDEIARRAGTGIATLYRRFPDRLALIRRVALDTLERSLAALDRAADAHPDAWDALVAYLHDVARERLTVLTLGRVPSLHEEFRQKGEIWSLRQEVLGRFERLVEAAREEGRLRDDVGAGDLIVWTVKVCRPLPVLTAELNDLAARRQLDMLIDGLRGTAADAPEAPGAPLRDAPLTIADLDAHLATP